VENLEKAAAIGRRNGDLSLEAWAMARLSARSQCLGQFDLSARAEEQALEIAGDIGDHECRHFALYWVWDAAALPATPKARNTVHGSCSI
jgi:hypothetical protein